MDGWADVPDVLLLHIYSYIPFRDKLAASSTCKNWRELLFHPANWSHVNFSYASSKGDRRREHFLKSKTGHFISSCNVYLPVDQLLLAEDAVDINSLSPSYTDSDVLGLFQCLSRNKNLSALTLVQSHQEYTDLTPTAVVGEPMRHSVNRHHGNTIASNPSASTSISINNNSYNNSWGDGALAKQSFAQGVLTRSQSHKLLEQHLKNNLLSCSQYLGPDDFNTPSHMLTSSNECSLNLSNIPLFNDNRAGANLQYVDYIKRIIAMSNALKHLSVGFLPTLTLHNNEIVKSLVRHQSSSLQSLHLSRCDELREFVYRPIDVQDLLTFRSLQHLSLDTADLSDELLVNLSEVSRVQLQSLCLSMFNHEEGVRLIHDRTWTLLHERCPELELTLNIIRCPQAIRDMMTVINHSMPLSHLRVLFCDEFYVPGFHHVARHQARTLRSLHIIESMREGPMYYDISVDEQDPFVMMAWRCKNLSSFAVIGIALREHDVLAVARLRGLQLRKFEVLEECITAFNQGEAEFEEDFAMSFETFCEEISTSIGQEWLPLTEDDIDDSIIYFDSPESKAFLPILLRDQQPVLTQSN